jgi:peptidase E
MSQIIAMGGGGFSMEPDNPLLDQYILDQAGRPRPKICFLPHATDDAVRYVHNFYHAFVKLDARPTYLSLFAPHTADLESFLMEQDVIYVGGGNTKSMLALWREWNLPAILKKACEHGTVLAGLSAGAICWFEAGVTDSIPGRLTPLPCLGFLPGSCCPHYDGEADRRPAYHRLIRAGQVAPGIALDDGAAAHFRGGQLQHSVSSRPHARTYLVRLEGDIARDEPLPINYLGAE